MFSVKLKKGRDKSARGRHPWIFSGAIDKVDGKGAPGDLVQVLDANGEFLAYGHFSPASQIQVRILEWHKDVKVDDDWWEKRISDAVARRGELIKEDARNSCRLIYAEADMLPGLIVDRYADFLVMQALTAGIDKIKHMLAQNLLKITGARGIYERSDVEVRKLEGLTPISGTLIGDTPDDSIEIKEGKYRFYVDIKGGQKTGFFLDQRDNRAIVAEYAKGRAVLDCFSYTGGFTVCALGAGAKAVTAIDSSAQAIDIAKRNLELNELKGAEYVTGNAFELLRSYRNEGKSFDMVILDPPKLSPTKAHADKAARAYKDINLLAMKLINPGGILATFSCSAGIDAGFFKEILFWASIDAGRDVQIARQLSQGADHPIMLAFPESEYLKGFVLKVL